VPIMNHRNKQQVNEMLIQIKQNAKNQWIASRGNGNTQLNDDELYAYLMAKKAQGFVIKFYANC